MRVKALFREYDYPNNTVSGTVGSNIITGDGTHFTELKAGTLIEIDDYGFAGKIASNPVSDTSLTLDRPITESFSGKIFWQDWSAYLVALSPTSRKVESKQAGRASVQVFDNMSLGFYFVPTTLINGVSVYNPVRAAFEGDLDSKKRYILKLQAVKRGLMNFNIITSTYDKLIDNLGNYIIAAVRGDECKTFFEGMVDFESIEYPVLKDSEGEKIASINFNVIDKLSALNILDSTEQQRNSYNAKYRISGIESDPNNIGFAYSNINYSGLGDVCVIYAYKKIYINNEAAPDYSNPWIQTEPLLQKGEILKSPDLRTPDTVYLILDSGILTLDGKQYTWIKCYPNLPPSLFNVSWSEFIPGCSYYGNLYYSLEDIGIYTPALSALNAVKILETIVKKRWPDLELTEGTLSVFSIPLNYFETLIDEKPFGYQPLEALRYVTDSINAYLFINRERKLCIQKRTSFETIPVENDKIITELYLDEPQKKFSWDKLVDGVEINVRSCIKDKEGKYIDGKGYAYPESKIIEPRNKLTKDVFLDENVMSENNIAFDSNGYLTDPTVTPISPLAGDASDSEKAQWKISKDNEQGNILNHYAAIIAAEYLSFYGQRHISYDMKLQKINWDDMLDWDLINTFNYNNERYFTTNLEFDFVEGTCKFELVSIQKFPYNRENTVVLKNPDTASRQISEKTYNNYGSGYSISTGYWSGSPGGLDPALGRSSLQLNNQYEGNPIGNLTPVYIGEDCQDTTTGIWYKATGLTNQDWKQSSNNYLLYTSGNDPNGIMSPQFTGQFCLVNYASISTWWKSKSLDSSSWVTFIDQRSATANDDFLMAEETGTGTGIFQWVKKTLAEIRNKLKLVTTATVVDHIVTFKDTTGGLKTSSKAIDSFPDKVSPSVTDNFVSFSNTTGSHKDSGKKASDFATSNHNHDSAYAAVNHNHDGSYSAIGHNHDGSYMRFRGVYSGSNTPDNPLTGDMYQKDDHTFHLYAGGGWWQI